MNKNLLAFTSFIFSISAVFAQPVITQNPQNTTVCVDSCANFSVSAVGDGLSYAWIMEDSAGQMSLVGNMATLQLCDSVIQFNSNAFYCLVVDQNGDSATSSSASLTVDSCLAPVADFYWDWSTTEICFTSTSARAETLFWLFGDGTTNASNVSEICHTYATDEIYFIKLIAYNAYGQDEVEKALNLLSIGEINTTIDIFPNPASENITIQSDKNIESVRIYSMHGSLVNSFQVNANQADLNLQGLENGIYNAILVIDGKTVQHRIVKQ